jgi:hypothetical protein
MAGKDFANGAGVKITSLNARNVVETSLTTRMVYVDHVTTKIMSESALVVIV